MHDHERFAWGYSPFQPYYDDHDQIDREPDPIFFRRKFIESKTRVEVKTNSKAERDLFQQEATRSHLTSNNEQKTVTYSSDGETRTSQQTASESPIQGRKDQGGNERQHTSHALGCDSIAQKSSGDASQTLDYSEDDIRNIDSTRFEDCDRSLRQGKALEEVFDAKGWPGHLMPLAERLGLALDQVFAEDLAVHCRSLCLSMALEKLDNIKWNGGNDEPQLSDSEFHRLVHDASFNAE